MIVADPRFGLAGGQAPFCYALSLAVGKYHVMSSLFYATWNKLFLKTDFALLAFLPLSDDNKKKSGSGQGKERENGFQYDRIPATVIVKKYFLFWNNSPNWKLSENFYTLFYCKNFFL